MGWKAALPRAGAVGAAGFAWTCLFWFTPADAWPVLGAWRVSMRRAAALLLGLDDLSAWAALSGGFVAAALAFIVVAGRRSLSSLGLGRASSAGWRLATLAFAVALPVVVVLGLIRGMQAGYAPLLVPAPAWRAISALALVMAAEHAWIPGALLALALPAGSPLPTGAPPRQGRLAFVGLGSVTGERGGWSWLGVPTQVFPAIVVQAGIFTAIHTTKHPAELVASFPGALGLGMLTYRARSAWPGFVLHLATSATFLAVVHRAAR